MFRIEGRILSREDYFADGGSKLSPTDLAIGWNKMANPENYKKLDISQSGRWYQYKWANQPPLPPSEIAEYSANMHIIPANDSVANVLKNTKKDQMIKIKGILVEIFSDNGWHWKSSTSRTDTGGGACEVIYAEAIEIEN